MGRELPASEYALHLARRCMDEDDWLTDEQFLAKHGHLPQDEPPE